MDIATNGTSLFVSKIEGTRVRVGGVITPEAPLGLLEDRLAVSPDGRIAVSAKTNQDKAYGWVQGASQWTYLGPAFGQMSQIVTFQGKFLFARIDRGGNFLVVQDELGTELSRRPTSTSQGILQWDPVDNDFILTDSRRNIKVGSRTMIKAVRRLQGTKVWWCGQVISPDRLVVSDGTNHYLAGPQPETPQFVIIGQDLYVNGGRKGPFPVDNPATPIPPPPVLPPPPTPMPEWKEDFRVLLVRFAEKFGIPKGTGEEAARQWAHKLAEQFCFSFGTSFGHKSAGPGRPHSADAIAVREGGKLYGWDVLRDAGGPDCQLVERPGTIDLTGQLFEVVSAVNHLAAPAPPPPPPPSTECKFTPCTCQAQPCLAPQVLADLKVQLADISLKLDELLADNHKERTLKGLRFVGEGRLSGVVD